MSKAIQQITCDLCGAIADVTIHTRLAACSFAGVDYCETVSTTDDADFCLACWKKTSTDAAKALNARVVT